eukprot:COSAG04_NODE_2436_length_4131_cov_12.161458_2_plen_525_part_00
MRTADGAGDRRFNEWYPSAAKSIKIVCFLTAAYLKSPYCMKEFGIAQAMDKLLVVACEPIHDITAVDPSRYPHASTALAYLLGGGQVIFHDKDDVVTEIMKFIPRQAAAAEPEPESTFAAASPAGGLGLPPNATSPLPAGVAAALGTETVQHLLTSATLDKYVAAFSAEGYVYLSDLLDADDEDLDGLVAVAGMKQPEAKRFRKALASVGGGGGGGGQQGGQEAARLLAEKQAAEASAAQEMARAAALQAQVDSAQQHAVEDDGGMAKMAQFQAERIVELEAQLAAEAQQRASAEEASVALARQLEQEQKMRAAAQAAEPEPAPALAPAAGPVRALLLIVDSLCTLFLPARARVQWRWARAHSGIDITGEGGAMATWKSPDNYQAAVCGEVLQAEGEAYAEFTWVRGGGGTFKVGVARAGADPSSVQGGISNTADSWMYILGNGGHTHNFMCPPWASGRSHGIKQGETVGLLLRRGSLSVYFGARQVGVMCTGLSGPLVWAADANQAGTVRIAHKRPPAQGLFQ